MSWRERRRARKAAKRLAAARKARTGKILSVVPPEGVPLRFPLAGIGARLGAQIIDLLVTTIAAIVLGLALAFATDMDGSTATALVSLIAFAIRTPYYIVTELVWNGRTLAKRWTGLRTISRDGRSLRAYQIVVRNLLREIEFFTPLTYLFAGFAFSGWMSLGAALWILVVIIVPWRSRTNARLGDLIAGTTVIEEPKPVLLHDVARATAPVTGDREERFVFSTAQLDAYGAYELQVLERLLRPPATDGKAPSREIAERRRQTMEDVARRIQHKIGYEERIGPHETEGFLQAFYRAERAYLESRKLFGDARADKTYREREEG